VMMGMCDQGCIHSEQRDPAKFTVYQSNCC
jgi:hypothetical protein